MLTTSRFKKTKDKTMRKQTMREAKQEEEQSRQILANLNKRKKDRIVKQIRQTHGKNVVLDYKKEFNFSEQWQNKEASSHLTSANLFEQLGSAYIIFAVVEMLLCVAGVWMVSTERYFGTRQLSSNSPVYPLLIVSSLIDSGIKTRVKYAQNLIFPELYELLKSEIRNILLAIYFATMLAVNVDSILMNFIQMVMIYFLYRKAAQTYRIVKMMEVGLEYENELKIMDLLFNIFIQAHTFAVVLYCASKINPGNNWVKSIGIEGEQFFSKYINSIYFACTTMLTIGYGDISPKNVEEKMVTIVIEIVGVIAFGYLLNEMGHTLSKIREKNETMERDVQTIGKIAKYYNLERKLKNKAKQFIMSNQQNSEELKVEDENRVLMKLNEDLRDQINLENSLKVVKSCIFFLCHWSKDMQNMVAQRLEKRVFAPNEKLVVNNEKQRIFIIKKGKVKVLTNRYGSDQEHRKIVKVIDLSKNAVEVSDNIYGYTAVFSNRPARLEAIAKDFTPTYSINREEFLFCIGPNGKDFQYYHEIKSRIDQSDRCEEWQAPKIRNIREHYCPSTSLVLHRFKKEVVSQHNRRLSYLREKKHRFSMFSDYHVVEDNHYEEDSQGTLYFQKIQTGKYFKSLEQLEVGSEKQLQLEEATQKKITESKKISQLSQIKEVIAIADPNSKSFQSQFQAVQEYTHFFNRSNLQPILLKLEQVNLCQATFPRPL